jgi:chromate transport protein ChrA
MTAGRLCPQCGTSLSNEDGTEIPVCPNCGKSSADAPTEPAVQDASIPPPATSLFDEEPMTWEEYLSWRKTAAGLKVLFGTALFSVAVNLAMGALSDLGDRTLRLDRGNFQGQQVGVLVLGCGGLMLIFGAIIGLLMCCATPYLPARNRALGAIYCMIAGVVAGLFFGFFRSSDPFHPAAEAVSLVLFAAGLFFVVALVLWLMYLSAVADYFGDRRMQKELIWLAVAWVGMSALSIVISMSRDPRNFFESDMRALLRLSVFFLNLIPTVWFATILIRISRLIGAKLSEFDTE